MAKKKKKHVIEYDQQIDDLVKEVVRDELQHPNRINNYNIARIPSRKPRNRRYNAPPHIIVVTDDDVSKKQAEKIFTKQLRESRAAKRRRILPATVVRSRSPCEEKKSARRASAFRSGAAGKGKTTIPIRKYRC